MIYKYYITCDINIVSKRNKMLYCAKIPRLKITMLAYFLISFLFKKFNPIISCLDKNSHYH